MALLDQSGGDKTEQATPRRLEEAAKRGQIAHSPEVQTVFVLMSGLMAVTFFGRELWQTLELTVAQSLGHLHNVPLSAGMMQGYAIGAALLFAKIVSPILICVVLGALLAGGLQSRFNTASEALTPNWERLSPAKGFQRVFSMKSAAPTALAAAKLALIVGLTYSVVQEVLSDPIFYSSVNAARIAGFLASSTSKICLRVGVVMILIAVADYGYQFWQNNRELMMTKEEMKEELKHTEGNPQVKNQQRRRRSAITMRRQLADVPKADVVVTNPTHYAVALRYDRKTMRAPKIVAKGVRQNALRIREIAAQNQVPIVENKSLARLMYRYGRVGVEIPAQLYTAVAEVLAWVYRTNRYRYYAEQMEMRQ
ncbi:MAG TPA: EscU/YscU/HrcU family type III secretion system export apparatus switch protein [Verrucomicrobiae bacterium]|nr:EscU/YscU/HrcU family type III secretion system export apparatus switch protein [Verrucomicrobiae bacterium]